MLTAKIAVSAAVFAIDKPYSYGVPEGIAPVPGQRVTVPFGRGNRRCEGVVLSLEPGDGGGLKQIDTLLDPEPLLSEEMLHLAAFMRNRYFCTFYDAIRVMLPAGLWYEIRDRFQIADPGWREKTIRQKTAPAVLAFLEDLGGAGDYSALRQAFPEEEELQGALRYLVTRKYVTTQSDFLRKISDKTERIASLSAPAEEVMEYARRRQRSAPVQYAALELLCRLGSGSVKELCYFTGATSATFNRLEKLGYVTLSTRPALRCRDLKPAKLEGPLVLNEEQEAARAGLQARMDREEPGVALLYGITGSGKTAVYLKLIQSCLDKGKSALLLVPEISLTPQLLSLLAAYFGDRVAVLHSSLSAGERYDQWKRVRAGNASVVVGTRSAVFAPCENLGLLILDEEQEHTYKSENSPRYHARETAIWRGARQKALVLLGSATPSVETMYRARTGVYGLYTLKERYNGMKLPRVDIVDMKEELKAGNDGTLSESLYLALRENLQAGQQTVLFLNRRGTSRMAVCVDCGYVPECPRCSFHMTYHGANGRLMCHFCGHSQPMPQRCPQCGGHLKLVGAGTQKVEEELLEKIPGIEVARMDADTVSATNSHEKILEEFQRKGTPVLLGTQMVTKGLNLPNVTLVGVLDADSSLYTSSFRAAETTFAMLTQVVGRAGRGEKPGRAVIQTMTPGHQVIALAADQDYEGFYRLEISVRESLGFPPFGDVVTLTFVGQDERQVLRASAQFREGLAQCLRQEPYRSLGCEVLGPAPAAVPKINYNYRYILSLRCGFTKELRELLAHLLRVFAGEKANRGVNAYADVNGYD